MINASYATLGFADCPLDAALDAIAAAGFSQTEILGQEPHLAVPPTGRALSLFRGGLEERGFRAWTVHAPMTRHVLGAPDEDWRRERVAVLAEYVRFAGGIDADKIVVHPVPNPCFVPDPQNPTVPARIREAVWRSMDDLDPVAREAGVQILLENLPYCCDYPYLTMGELRPLVDAYPAAQVGLALDTGHAWALRNDPAAEIRIAGARLGGTHLQDVDYDRHNDDHWVPGQGGLDWDAIRSALSQVRYAGAWTFETVHEREGQTPEGLAHLTREVARAWGL